MIYTHPENRIDVMEDQAEVVVIKPYCWMVLYQGRNQSAFASVLMGGGKTLKTDDVG
jgi:hypothetical protein